MRHDGRMQRNARTLPSFSSTLRPLLLSLPLLAALAPSSLAGVCVPGFNGGAVFRIGSNQGTSALVDLDRDGNVDLTTGSEVLLGDGLGGFPTRRSIEGRRLDVFEIVIRDFDRDGILDAAQGGLGDGGVDVLYGRIASGPEDSLFERPVTMASVDQPWHMVSADLDEDGLLDLVAVSFSQAGIAIHLNNGGRKFRAHRRVSMPIPGHALATGDFNGDGHADIAVGHGDRAMILFGNGDGTMRLSKSLDPISVNGSPVMVHRFRAHDLDGDGRDELLAVGVPNSVVGYWGKEITVDNGLPARPSFSSILAGGGRFLEIADANRDGIPDLVAQGERDSSFVQILYGVRGDPPAFQSGPEFMTGLSGHGSVLAVGDINRDQHPDIVLTTEDTLEGKVYLNDGSCYTPTAVRGDVNMDRRINVADGIGVLSYLLLKGTVFCPAAADANGDHRVNIADPVFLLQYIFAHGPAPDPSVIPCIE